MKAVSGAAAVLLGVCASLGFSADARAAEPATAADVARLQGEIARMQQEMREQRQLILQVMQMHDALLKYVAAGGTGAPPPAASNLPPPPSAGAAAAAGTTAAGTTATTAARPAEPSTAGVSGARGTVSGRIRMSGGAAGDSYVYVDGPKAMAPHSSSIEVKQSARQFVPTVSVVQVGTRVFFPNADKVLHNVFSPTPGDAFDLGGVKAGDRPNPVALLKPGHVEVFCNIHSGMRADILVVPNGHWTRVRPDGSFQISGVPVGGQRVVLWGPNVKPVSQRIEVTPAGATVTFTAEALGRKRHLNKHGGAYESYED